MRKMMMRVATVAAVLSGAAVAGEANAAVLLFSSGNYTSGTFGRSGIAAGEFTDTLKFNVGWWHDLTSSLTSTATKLKTAGKGDIDFKKIVLSWKGKTDYEYAIENNGGFTGKKDSAELEQLLRPGAYTLSISGYSFGGGSYSGQTFAEAVPEPATWAMMIGGIGMAGCAMRRRRSTAVRVTYA